MKQTIFLLSLSLLISCGDDNPVVSGPKTFASSDIYAVTSTDGKIFTPGELTGNVELVYQDGVTTMEVSVYNMEPGTSHAMHLHMGTLEEPDRHWNQNIFTPFCNERSLGELWAKLFAGDIGNIEIDADGVGTFTIQTDLWTLGEDADTDIQNTVLYIHQKPEDFAIECDPNHGHTHGHTNAKIAGGTIVLGSQILQ
ncbi:MAG: superoxide dismutase family protein [Cyclobacteriaceae bacterium]